MQHPSVHVGDRRQIYYAIDLFFSNVVSLRVRDPASDPRFILMRVLENCGAIMPLGKSPALLGPG